MQILINGVVEWGKLFHRWHWKVATIESFSKIAFVAADGLVDCDQVSTRHERSLDLQLLESRNDGRIDLSAAKNLSTEDHQVCD
jgi:hypothetical protein